MKLRGKVEKRDLEGGIYQLVQAGGAKTTLLGARTELAAAVGHEVEIEGEPGGGFGLAMSGPQVKVSSVKKI
jgi:hypothetical protein